MKKALLILFFALSFSSQAQFWQNVSTSFSTVSSGVSEISYAIDPNTIWVSAYDGVTVANNVQKWAKTSDNGATWTSGTINVGNANLGIGDMSAIDASNCYVLINPTATSGTALGGVWKTSDGGVSWVKQSTASYNAATSFPNIVHFFNENDGVTMGDPAGGYFEIYTTSNGGTNWTRVASSNIPLPLNTDEFGYTGKREVRGNTIWFGTSVGRVYRSTDKGLTWTVGDVTPVPDFGGAITSGTSGDVMFRDDNNGLLMDNNYGLWDTTDGGTTWNSVAYSGDYRTSQMAYVPGTPNTYVVTGNDITNDLRGTSFTEDGGLNWININDLEPTPPNTGGSIDFYDCTHGIIGGFTTSSTVGGAYMNTHDYCVSFATSTFSNDKLFSANISNKVLEVYGKDITNVTVFDVLGKQVLNNNFTSVTNASLNVDSLNSAVYLVKVTNNLGNTSTIKVVKN